MASSGSDSGGEDSEGGGASGAEVDEPHTEEERLALAAFGCAERGDTTELRRLAEEDSVDLGMIDEGGCSLAHEAAAEGQASVIRLLGEGAGDMLQRVRSTLDKHEAELGWTPFHAAASQGHGECIVALAQIAYNAGAPSAMAAADILEARDCDGGTPLHVAAMSGHVVAINALLEIGEPLDIPMWTPVGARDSNNLTALQTAIIEGRVEAVRALVRWGCTYGSAHDVRLHLLGANDASGFSNAFHFAAASGQAAVINGIQDEMWQHFRERSSRPMIDLLSAPDADHMTPLHRAVTRGHAACCAPLDFSVTGEGSLLLHDAWGVCALDGQGRSSAHLAAAGGHVECLHELLRIGLPVRWLLRADASRGLPTQYAAHHGQLSFLLELTKATQRPEHYDCCNTINTGSAKRARRPSKRASDSRIPIWQRARPKLGDGVSNGLEAPECGCSLLHELQRDTSISDSARKVAANAAWCFLTAAYQRLAFAAIFTPTFPSLRLRGGTSATIDTIARLPRAGNRSWIRADGKTFFEDIETSPGWVEILGPSLRRLVGAGYAATAVAARFSQQGGWTWNTDPDRTSPATAGKIVCHLGRLTHKRSSRPNHGSSPNSSTNRRKRDRSVHNKKRRRGASKVLIVTIDD